MCVSTAGQSATNLHQCGCWECHCNYIPC